MLRPVLILGLAVLALATVEPARTVVNAKTANLRTLILGFDGLLPVEPILQRVQRCCATGSCDGGCQWNLFWTHRHAVLSVSADLNSALVGQRIQAFTGLHFPDRMRIEQDRLADRMGTNKALGVGLVLASFECVVSLVVALS